MLWTRSNCCCLCELPSKRKCDDECTWCLQCDMAYMYSATKMETGLETNTLCYKYETNRAYSRPCTKQIQQTWASFRLLLDLIPRWHPYQRQFILWPVKKNGIFSGFCAWRSCSERIWKLQEQRQTFKRLKPEVFQVCGNCEVLTCVRLWCGNDIWAIVQFLTEMLSHPSPLPLLLCLSLPCPHPLCWSNCSLLPVYIPKAEKFYGCGFSLFSPLWMPEFRRQRETVQTSAKFTTEKNV